MSPIKYDFYEVFTHPEWAHEDGLLAAGGDLNIDTLLLTYSNGIFPWYSGNSPILWWCPDPRMVLYPEKMKVSQSLKQTLKNDRFTVRFDSCFKDIIENCARVKRKGQDGTWITQDMKDAYINFHNEGYAHSVEVFNKNKLAGGLYGVSLGGTFFGESMFHLERDASKVALFNLVQKLIGWNFDLIDVQQSTEHMRSLGAEEISRDEFLKQLRQSLKKETRRGRWG